MLSTFRKSIIAMVLLLLLASTGFQPAGAAPAAAGAPEVPLAPGLNWNNLGSTPRNIQINVKGDYYVLEGQTFQASEKFPAGVPQAVESFYSNAALFRNGWVSDNAFEDKDGSHRIFYHESGYYLAVEALQCADDPASTCLTVWESAAKDTARLVESQAAPAEGVSPQVIFGKKTPADGSTGLNPLSVYLSWTSYTGAEKYKYCVKQGAECADNDPDWTGTFLNQSVTISNLNPNQAYKWQVKATTCLNCTPKPWVEADNGVWWDFSTTTGSVLISGNAGVSGAVLSYFDGSSKTATADSSGNYSLRVSYNWSGTVTPFKTGFVFTPQFRSYNNLTANLSGQNYIANTGVSISGNAGIGGAVLKWTDGTLKSVTADSNGFYNISVPYNWSGTVTPSKTGYVFTPNFKSYANLTTNLTGQNFTAQLVRFSIAGNAGVGGAVMTYVDGTTKTVTADSAGNYTVNVPYNWSGKITPSKAGVFSFTPAFRSYTNVLANTTNQNYVANFRVTFVSVAPYDGFVIESNQTSNVGGNMNSTAGVIAVGDGKINNQYRGFLSFATSILPDTAVITTAKLSLTKSFTAGTNPFSSFGLMQVDLKNPFFGASPALGLDDFNFAPSLVNAASFNSVPVGSVYSANFTAGSLSLFNRTGPTQLRLRFQLQDNGNSIADYVAFFSGESLTVANRPVLTIIYHLP